MLESMKYGRGGSGEWIGEVSGIGHPLAVVGEGEENMALPSSETMKSTQLNQVA